jgi:hypothetical protein
MTRSAANLRLEQRPDGSVLVTRPGGNRWGFAAVGIGAAALLLGSLAGGRVGLLGAVVVLPLAVIALLAGLAATRHRDWILFDRVAREVVFRRGLRSIFQAARVFPFSDVEAVVVEGSGDAFEVALLRTGDVVWPMEASADSEAASRLVTALHAVGGWPALHNGAPFAPPYRLATPGARQ